ncbi:branched-chain amino acid transport system / permease component family protein, partial [Vibrio parahaemolyticus V-223/04]
CQPRASKVCTLQLQL